MPKRYKCGCGKDYSSLANLNTHLRLKHLDERPKGTYRPKRRGRPKKP